MGALESEWIDGEKSPLFHAGFAGRSATKKVFALLDTFWRRIVQHPMVWQGIYCRDYGAERCVWRTLHGRAGSEQCLCHLDGTDPSLFIEICRQITSIPGRSNEELLASYRAWRQEEKASP